MQAQTEADVAASRLEQGAILVGACALTITYAMPGGAYDVVVRGEFAVGLWWIIALSLLVGILPRGRITRPWAGVAIGWGLLAVLTACALRSTTSDERTTIELARVLHHGGVLALVVLTVRRATAPAAMAGLAAGAIVVCVIALTSRLAPGVFPEDVAGTVFESTASRLSYPMDYWNALGAWGAMASTICLALGAHVARRSLRVLAAACVPVAVVVVYLTFSRGGAVGVIIGAVSVVLLSRNRWTAVVHALVASGASVLVIAAIRRHEEIDRATGGDGGLLVGGLLVLAAVIAGTAAFATSAGGADERLRLGRRGARLLALTACVVLVVAAGIAGPGFVSDAWDSFNRPESAAAASADRLTSFQGDRRNLYPSAIAAGRDHPWSGVGPGAFEFWWNQDARSAQFVRDAHSLYLEMFAELGWPGALAILLAVGSLVAGSLRVVRRLHREGSALQVGVAVAGTSALLVFVVQAGLDWMWESTATAVLGLAAGGVAMAGLAPGRPSAFVSLPVRSAVAAAAVAAALVQLPPLVSTNRLRDSQQASSAGNPAGAMSAVIDAIDTEPWAASPYAQRALLHERAGALAAAELDIRRSIAREPQNWRYELVLARVLAERGKVRAAVAAYRRARDLRPLSAVFRRAAAPPG